MPGTITKRHSGQIGHRGYAPEIGVGMMYRIGGLGVGRALRLTAAASLGF